MPVFAVLSLVWLAARPATAQVDAYTSSTAFAAALPGAPTVVDFEGFATGALLPSGSTLAPGVTLTYDIPDGAGGQLVASVVDDFDTTSGTRSLGLDDPFNLNQLVLGDELDLGFAAGARAVGLFVVSSDPLLAGDVRLVVGAGEAANGASAETTLPDGGLAYFVGLVADAPFASAGLRYDASAIGAALFTIDDLQVLPAPEPAAATGGLAGLAALTAIAARRRAARNRTHERDGRDRRRAGPLASAKETA